MHEIEPYYRWRDDYIASEDPLSPFVDTKYNEFEFDKQIYNYLIHPQWDFFGSQTLYLKVLYADYDLGHYASTTRHYAPLRGTTICNANGTICQ